MRRARQNGSNCSAWQPLVILTTTKPCSCRHVCSAYSKAPEARAVAASRSWRPGLQQQCYCMILHNGVLLQQEQHLHIGAYQIVLACRPVINILSSNQHTIAVYGIPIVTIPCSTVAHRLCMWHAERAIMSIGWLTRMLRNT